jgi:hypothetical protein
MASGSFEGERMARGRNCVCEPKPSACPLPDDNLNHGLGGPELLRIRGGSRGQFALHCDPGSARPLIEDAVGLDVEAEPLKAPGFSLYIYARAFKARHSSDMRRATAAA